MVIKVPTQSYCFCNKHKHCFMYVYPTDLIQWTKENLERLRLCRNRAYAKVNTKRRQHLPASLSSFLLREWQSTASPGEFPKVSASYLLNVYVRNFEAGSKEKKRFAASRKRGRTDATVPSSEANPNTEFKSSREERSSRSLSQDDHANKQWSEAMLENLLECGEIAKAKLQSNASGRTGSSDISSLLLEEWLKIYPRSTLTSRNLKSRLTVYSKTRSEMPPPSKRRKTAPPQTTISADEPSSDEVRDDPSVEKIVPRSDLLEAMEALKSTSADSPDSMSFITKLKTDLEEKIAALKDISTSAFQSYCAQLTEDSKPTSANGVESRNGVMDEISDEFVPEQSEDETRRTDASDGHVDKMEEEDREDDDDDEEKMCEKHWMHMFHDDDKSVECILTDQMLEVRQRLEPSFPGCDLYHPKKPKGEP